MSKEFDVEKIAGYENMDEDDISYFRKYGFAMADQAEVIMNQCNIDSETMRDAYAWYMNDLVNNKGMYIVEGASLACTMQDNSEHYLNSESGTITSQVNEEQIAEMSTLRIVEKREANFSDFIPAVVTDAKGGIRDKAQNHISIKDENSINIVSFGNCQNIPDGEELETLVKEIHKSVPYQNDAWSMDRIKYEMKKAIEQGKGICYCCMLLNPEWENLPIEYDFFSESFKVNRDFRISPISGIDQSYQQINGREQINMMSMLFCQRGGIITAKESGQQVEELSVQEMLWRDLKEMGYSDIAVAAIMGNIAWESAGYDVGCIESGDDPTAENIGIGLCQWTYNTRKQGLFDFAEELGAEWNTYYVQINYMKYEIFEDSEFASVKPEEMNKKDLEGATELFMWNYENPRKSDAHLDDRIRLAEEALHEYCKE